MDAEGEDNEENLNANKNLDDDREGSKSGSDAGEEYADGNETNRLHVKYPIMSKLGLLPACST